MTPEVVVTSEVAASGGFLWGLEGRHRWDGRLTLNNLAVWPRYHVRSIPGLSSAGDPEDRRDNAIARPGEIPRRSFRRGKTVSYEGDIEALNMIQLREAIRDLRAAFDDVATEKQMVVTAHPSFAAGSAYYWARALEVTIGEEQLVPPGHITRGFSRPFAVAVRWSDARYYDGLPHLETTGSVIAGGGAAPPFVPPFTIPGPDEGAGAVTLTSAGTTQTDPTITIYGPVTNPLVENVTHGLKIALTGLVLGASDFVRLQFHPPRRVLLQGTTDASGLIDADDSNWWDSDVALPLGTQTIRFGGKSISDPARAEIAWNDAYS
jgi:hypothetical protein